MELFYKLKLYLLVELSWSALRGSALPENIDVEGYYWRDYIGKIPHDAIEGGPDGNGDTMYIGQTVYMGIGEAILIPGQINAENQTLTFEWGSKERTTTEDMKILCTNHPERFEWLRTSTDEITRLKDYSLVMGGSELNYTVYIGRVMLDGQFTIAKVNFVDDKALLHATKDGKGEIHHKFEILNYNRHIPAIEKIVEAVERKLTEPNSAEKVVTPFSSFVVIVVALLYIL